MQLAPVPHGVPVTWNRHTPVPLHSPSNPHVAGACTAHVLCGSSPPGTAVHVPTEPATLHARHPVHTMSQQNPSAHVPVRHCGSRVHADALAFFATQLVPSQ